MFLNLSPLGCHLGESLTSLRFATKVNIKKLSFWSLLMMRFFFRLIIRRLVVVVRRSRRGLDGMCVCVGVGEVFLEWRMSFCIISVLVFDVFLFDYLFYFHLFVFWIFSVESRCDGE
jgi:hypothetical protein